ncbi:MULTISPECIES: hypothetical protein [unclassified Arthrobacter]|uniref:hypothetical protein n=1 Tax=unclassified Arthrobacter TaxID=235627 RepID=UPI00288AA067|nr:MULTISPECIES: hypothetical protein [unclassified Arthrobacter]
MLSIRTNTAVLLPSGGGRGWGAVLGEPAADDRGRARFAVPTTPRPLSSASVEVRRGGVAVDPASEAV